MWFVLNNIRRLRPIEPIVEDYLTGTTNKGFKGRSELCIHLFFGDLTTLQRKHLIAGIRPVAKEIHGGHVKTLKSREHLEKCHASTTYFGLAGFLDKLKLFCIMVICVHVSRAE